MIVNEPSKLGFELFNRIAINNLTTILSDKQFILVVFLYSPELFSFIEKSVINKYSIKYTTELITKWADSNQYFHCINFDELQLLHPYEVNSDSSQIESWCVEILKINEKSIVDYRNGKTGALNHLKGQVMKTSKGKADARIVSEILERLLKNS
jgi:Asp-tRNA(Asn)/Glu-tRNA(Gln) amidotransferase B subunit